MDKAFIFSGQVPSATLTRQTKAGQLRRVARGIYTTDLKTSPARLVRDGWPQIAARLVPRAVISDRSGRTSAPVNAVLYLVHTGPTRSLSLPGLEIAVRNGAGPIDGDIELPDGLFQASKARVLAENSRATRARGSAGRRTFTPGELADWIDDICAVEGEGRLQAYRDQMEAIAAVLGIDGASVTKTSTLIGAALGTKTAKTKSAALSARQAGRPYDRLRLNRFGLLITALHQAAPQSQVLRQGTPQYKFSPFFEAYFSNYIEGTEFSFGEATAAIFDHDIPYGRTADGHDLVGTYEVVSDDILMSEIPSTGDDFLQILRARNRAVMGGRPEKNPGQFKEHANRAGETQFVDPDLVETTLSVGFDRIGELDTAWERAVYIAFLIAEVHPFADGNGRVARIMMNSQLHAGGQGRIIVPTSFRNDYMDGLRLLSREDDSSIFIKGMRFLHTYTAMIDFSTLEGAHEILAQSNAFADPFRGAPLELPAPRRHFLTRGDN